MASDGAESEVEREIWMLLVGHFIARSWGAAGRSNEDGWLDTTQASVATNTRIGFGRRIGESKNKIVGEKAVGAKRSQLQAKLLADSTTSRWVFAKKETRT
jgi:hypothetical protein